MIEFGRLLVIIGVVTAVSGLLILVAVRYLPWLGNLPGDIRFESGNMRFYFPLATMLLISILGSILLNIVIRIFNR
ncbi:MAG: DUF2905 domain-containing protein [Chloroflexota bacterium]